MLTKLKSVTSLLSDDHMVSQKDGSFMFIASLLDWRRGAMVLLSARHAHQRDPLRENLHGDVEILNAKAAWM